MIKAAKRSLALLFHTVFTSFPPAFLPWSLLLDHPPKIRRHHRYCHARRSASGRGSLSGLRPFLFLDGSVQSEKPLHIWFLEGTKRRAGLLPSACPLLSGNVLAALSLAIHITLRAAGRFSCSPTGRLCLCRSGPPLHPERWPRVAASASG